MTTRDKELDRDRRSQRERAAGTFELRIEVAPTTEAGWKSLRQALRFSRADDPWLRLRVPGPVRRGARADLEALLSRVEAAAHAGVIVRRNPETTTSMHDDEETQS